MTREEALQILDTIPTIGEQVDALEMAIEALSVEPCEDCISRAEAIKALEYNLSVEADGGLDKYRTVIKDLLNAIYNTQKKAIEDLPSIQPKPKTDVLDKIRTEIIENSIEDYKYHGCGTDELIIETTEVLNILDKYKAESENKE